MQMRDSVPDHKPSGIREERERDQNIVGDPRRERGRSSQYKRPSDPTHQDRCRQLEDAIGRAPLYTKATGYQVMALIRFQDCLEV